MRTIYLDRSGREVSEQEAKIGGILRDGFSISTRVTMMDSRGDSTTGGISLKDAIDIVDLSAPEHGSAMKRLTQAATTNDTVVLDAVAREARARAASLLADADGQGSRTLTDGQKRYFRAAGQHLNDLAKTAEDRISQVKGSMDARQTAYEQMQERDRNAWRR